MAVRRVPRARAREKQKLATWKAARCRYLEVTRFLESSSIIIPIMSRENGSVAWQITKFRPHVSIYRLPIVPTVCTALIYHQLNRCVLDKYLILKNESPVNRTWTVDLSCLMSIIIFAGDVDSADNEDETDSETQMRANHDHNHDEAMQRRHVYENNDKNNTTDCNAQCGASNMMSNNCYLSNSHGALRPNQLFRSRVKHETKLWVVLQSIFAMRHTYSMRWEFLPGTNTSIRMLTVCIAVDVAK